MREEQAARMPEAWERGEGQEMRREGRTEPRPTAQDPAGRGRGLSLSLGGSGSQ